MLTAQQAYRFQTVIHRRPWLRLVETSANQIPEALCALDPDLFLVRNVRRGCYEVHDAAVSAEYFTMVLEANELDGRIIERIRAARLDQDPIKRADEWAILERRRMQASLDTDVGAVCDNLREAIRFDTEGRHSFAVKE